MPVDILNLPDYRVLAVQETERVKLISGVWGGLRKAASPAEIETV